MVMPTSLVSKRAGQPLVRGCKPPLLQEWGFGLVNKTYSTSVKIHHHHVNLTNEFAQGVLTPSERVSWPLKMNISASCLDMPSKFYKPIQQFQGQLTRLRQLLAVLFTIAVSIQVLPLRPRRTRKTSPKVNARVLLDDVLQLVNRFVMLQVVLLLGAPDDFNAHQVSHLAQVGCGLCAQLDELSPARQACLSPLLLLGVLVVKDINLLLGDRHGVKLLQLLLDLDSKRFKAAPSAAVVGLGLLQEELSHVMHHCDHRLFTFRKTKLSTFNLATFLHGFPFAPFVVLAVLLAPVFLVGVANSFNFVLHFTRANGSDIQTTLLRVLVLLRVELTNTSGQPFKAVSTKTRVRTRSSHRGLVQRLPTME